MEWHGPQCKETLTYASIISHLIIAKQHFQQERKKKPPKRIFIHNEKPVTQTLNTFGTKTMSSLKPKIAIRKLLCWKKKTNGRSVDAIEKNRKLAALTRLLSTDFINRSSFRVTRMHCMCISSSMWLVSMTLGCEMTNGKHFYRKILKTTTTTTAKER